MCVGGVAVGEDLLANKEGNGLHVVFKCGGRVVRCTDAVHGKSILETVSINHRVEKPPPERPTVSHWFMDGASLQRVVQELNWELHQVSMGESALSSQTKSSSCNEGGRTLGGLWSLAGDLRGVGIGAVVLGGDRGGQEGESHGGNCFDEHGDAD